MQFRTNPIADGLGTLPRRRLRIKRSARPGAAGLEETEEVAAYRASFVYCIYGRRLRGTLYPPRTILYRVRGARYVNEGHGHRVQVVGEVRRLHALFFTTTESRVALAGRATKIRTGRSRSSVKVPFRKPFYNRSTAKNGMASALPRVLYVLLVKGCLLDGWAGWFYALQRVLAETTLALELIDRSLRDRPII